MATASTPQQLRASITAEGEGLVLALVDELADLAQLAAQQMRLRAPKWQSALTNSIRAEEVSPFEWHVRPGVEYAKAVEDGVKPGGKGLPRWADPEAADIKAWLTSKAFAGRRRARRNSMKAKHEDQELRDRYEGLAWHVRHFGVKAQPYMRPTVEIMGRIFAPRLEQAARNYMAANGGGGAA